MQNEKGIKRNKLKIGLGLERVQVRKDIRKYTNKYVETALFVR